MLSVEIERVLNREMRQNLDRNVSGKVSVHIFHSLGYK